MKRLFLLVTFLALMLPVMAYAWTQGDVPQFEKANKNYREGHFKEAISLYEELAREHKEVWVFFYNLGNSYHRTSQRGQAILAYKRAQRLDPRNQDILYNLRYVQGLGEYRIQDKRNWYVKFGMRMLDYVTEKEVGVLAFGFFFLFMAAWAFVLFFRPEASWGWGRKILLFLTLFFGIGFGLKNIQNHVIREAIVLSKDTPARYGPSDSDQVAFKLGEGLSAYVVDTREGWSRIFLVNGESGWVDNHNIAEVLPA